MAWLLLLAPLTAAFLVLSLFRHSPKIAQLLSIGACLVSFAVSIGLWHGCITPPNPIPWLSLVGLNIEMGILSDELSRLMLLVVTGVGFLIHVFSLGYMAEDEGRARFFGELSMFMFSMIGIVVANNLMMMFIFWELVGLSSYLLIGFWFQKPSAAEAAKKAFMVNRIGDFGFLLGILLFWAITNGSISLTDTEALKSFEDRGLLTVLALLLFCGCVGKSAMIPLHVWLPDAMEGPTPVSALIHAATMVAAGVYMLCRIFFILSLSTEALFVIAIVGAGTALFAALIATQQSDIKRILAYSTLSQLGYMVMAVGCAAPVAAMFHLTTHAFFKAMLFLGAGSVIHALHHEQDIWKMGGLRHKMPWTFRTFLVGVLALCGVPFLSGFYSKEEILFAAYDKHIGLFVIAAVTAALTTFYMLRLLFVAFLGPIKSDAVEHAHESPWVMVGPLIVLAIPSIFAGKFGITEYLHGPHPHENTTPILIASITAVILGAGFAYKFYWNRRIESLRSKVLAHKFYVDEFYDGILVPFQQLIARVFAFIDTWIIGLILVRGSAIAANFGGEFLRLLQAGNLQGYAFLFGVGVVGVLYYALKGF